jgi:hypothetical protein
MLPSISPPTDNLYKFMAIIGLAFCIAAIIQSNQLNAVDHRLQETADSLRTRLISLELKDTTDSLRSETSLAMIDTLFSEYRSLDANKLHLKASTYQGLLTTSDYIVLKTAHDRYLRLHKSLFTQRIIVLIITTIGLLLVFGGFYMWYVYDQTHTDTILRYQALAASTGGDAQNDK